MAAFLYVNVAQADVDLAISKSPISIPKLSTDSAVLSSDLQVAYLQADNKLHIISGYDSEIDTPIELPQQIGTYDSIAWNSTNTKLALTENSQDKGKLWVLQLNQSKEKSYAPRLLLEQENRPVIDPAFDPKDEFLAYTVYKQDKPEVWVTNLRTFGKEKVANGSKAAWSHNGRYLSFEQNGEVCIYDRQTGEIKEKVRGSSPSWFSAKQLTILSPDGVMLMGTMDETIKNWKK
ncbi:TolB family protein [Brevibacillus laterosporus]